MSLRQEIPRFISAGAVGFVVDVGGLYLALALGLDYYSGRAGSFSVAVLSTWLINRRWTFPTARTDSAGIEFARYLGAMALGGAVNYAFYAVIVTLTARSAWLPLFAVSTGATAGLVVNFTIAKAWVFRRSVTSNALARPHGRGALKDPRPGAR